MELCRDCFVLRGPFFDHINTCERMQRCACESKEPPWNEYDFNCAIGLCCGCTAEVVRSGSSWSVFFCESCKPRVMAYDRRVGAALIPLGRHSLMNNSP